MEGGGSVGVLLGFVSFFAFSLELEFESGFDESVFVFGFVGVFAFSPSSFSISLRTVSTPIGSGRK